MIKADQVAGEPTGNTNFFIIGDVKIDRVNVNYGGYYHDRVRSRVGEAIYLDSYWVSNFSLNYVPIAKLELSFEIKNAFNERYRTWSPQAGIERGLPERGRAFYLGVKLLLS